MEVSKRNNFFFKQKYFVESLNHFLSGEFIFIYFNLYQNL